MEKKLDLRIQKTYAALLSSFQELLCKKPFEKITVQELCDNALVRRATFYKHFGDIYELFAFMIREIAASYKRPDKKPPEDFISYCMLIVNNAFTFLENNEKLVKSIFKSAVLDSLLTICSEQIVFTFQDFLRQQKQPNNIFMISPEFTAQAFTGALISTARWWAVNNKPISKEEVIEYSMLIIQKMIA